MASIEGHGAEGGEAGLSFDEQVEQFRDELVAAERVTSVSFGVSLDIRRELEAQRRAKEERATDNLTELLASRLRSLSGDEINMKTALESARVRLMSDPLKMQPFSYIDLLQGVIVRLLRKPEES